MNNYNPKETILKIQSLSRTAFIVVLIFFLAACASSDVTRAENRIEVLSMSVEVLQQLYLRESDAKKQLKEAAGYAVFDNANLNFIVASVGGGYGVAVNNITGAKTYMKMAEAGIGFGAGVKDFSLVMIFHDVDALNRFTEQGWAFGAQADAGAKAGDQGVAAGAEVSIDNVTIYQITQNGIALQLTVKGTKFYKDSDLN
jgi:lipid-binding SYLF domain-containing protein